MEQILKNQREIDREDAAPTAISARETPSAARAWFYLVWLCFFRQARIRQMVWISLGLLAVTAVVVGLKTATSTWGMTSWRYPRSNGPTFGDWLNMLGEVPRSPLAASVQNSYVAVCRMMLARSDFFVYSNYIVFSIFLGFLMPIWNLSFATDAIGGEREARTLIWLSIQPLPRWSIYGAKYVAVLPYCLGLNIGGFFLLCVAAGSPGKMAFSLYLPAVICGTLAFTALFHLMGAAFRRSGVMAIVYSFFIETILGNMPGYMKRISIGFYTKCMMFDRAEQFGIQPEKPSIYIPVDGKTGGWVLIGLTVIFLVVGMVIFSRSEYRDLT